MNNLELTNHANERLSQRGMTLADAVMIVDFGTEVDGGFIFLEKNCDALECELRATLRKVRRLRGKRVVLKGTNLVTAFHATNRTMRKLVRCSEERQQENWS